MYVYIYISIYIYLYIYTIFEHIYVFDIYMIYIQHEIGVYMVHDMPQTAAFLHQHGWLDDPQDQVCRFLGTVGYLDVLLS